MILGNFMADSCQWDFVLPRKTGHRTTHQVSQLWTQNVCSRESQTGKVVRSSNIQMLAAFTSIYEFIFSLDFTHDNELTTRRPILCREQGNWEAD